MSDMKAFEIYTYQSSKWKIDSVFDDRDLALFEAQRMDESGRYTGIRVIEEIHVESTQETKTRTIYRGNKVAAENAEQLRKAKQTRINAGKAKKEAAGRYRTEQDRRKAPQDQKEIEPRTADRDHADHCDRGGRRHVRSAIRTGYVTARIRFARDLQQAKTRPR